MSTVSRDDLASVSRLTLARIGRNESIASDERRSRAEDTLLLFRCECEGERCSERLPLTYPDYLWIRGHPGWLIVAPGHVVAGTVVAQRVGGSFVVESRHEG